jgi:S1-C subfamily serine protease
MHGFVLSRRLFWAAILFLVFVALRPWLEDLLVQFRAEPRAVTARGELAADEQTTIAIFDRISPSVVYIATTGAILDPWTRDLRAIRRGTGSGLIWDDYGHIVTNFHVVEDARSAIVRFSDHRAYQAWLVGASPEHDLAVLRIDAPASRSRPVPIGTSADLKVGQKVFAIGNPFGLDYSLTTGIVSALDRTIEAENDVEIRQLIQTDAAINPGNSGGPLLDSAGRLIGVNTAIYSPSGSFSGIGFAVPVDTVNRVVPYLIASGRYVRPRIGIVGDDDASRPVLDGLGLHGVLVLRVESGSPAERAGVRGTAIAADGSLSIGDVITDLDGQPVSDMGELISLLERYSIGDEVRLGIVRDGAALGLDLRLGGAARNGD